MLDDNQMTQRLLLLTYFDAQIKFFKFLTNYISILKDKLIS